MSILQSMSRLGRSPRGTANTCPSTARSPGQIESAAGAAFGGVHVPLFVAGAAQHVVKFGMIAERESAPGECEK